MQLLGFAWVVQFLQRGNIRKKYQIDGDECKDCCLVFWCGGCELCQEHRETEIRGPLAVVPAVPGVPMVVPPPPQVVATPDGKTTY